MTQEVKSVVPALIALRGVSLECPENTMSSIRAAVCQGYSGIQLDVQVTADGMPVIGREPDVGELCWNVVRTWDVGGKFARKFQGEGMPLLTAVLEFVQTHSVSLWLNMALVSRDREEAVFELLRERKDISICSSDWRCIIRAATALPNARLVYDGVINAEALHQLAFLNDRLTVWLPDTPDALKMASECTALGIGPVESYDRLQALQKEFAPVAISSRGKVKPELRRGIIADVHVHSDHSPDGKSPVEDILRDAQAKGVGLVCVTDHCDIRPADLEEDILQRQHQTVKDIRKCGQTAQGCLLLAGVEMAGGFLRPNVATAVSAAEQYDEIIGSVHGIMFHGARQSTAAFDFGNVSRDDMMEYWEQHLLAALHNVENLDMDVLGHLTYILRYINGKHKLGMDWRIQELLTRRILEGIIRRGIALEINTSCRGGFYDEWLPSREIVDLYLEMGGYLFTLGSDAHRSTNIGSYFEEVIDYLRSRGVRFLMYYQDRIPHQYSI